MQYDQFVGRVQHRARCASSGDAVQAIRATLETLAERLAGGEARHLAAQLAREIGCYLEKTDGEPSARLSLNEFFHRVSARTKTDLPKAIFHARAVMSVLQDAVSAGEIKDVRSQLPAEYGPLFEFNGDTAEDEPRGEKQKVMAKKMKSFPQSEQVTTETAPGGTSASPSPTHDEIASIAYSLYERDGRQPGHELEHWLQAESLLRSQNNPQAARETAPA